MNDKVSIIVPIYTQETLITQCIDSLISQSYTNIEIILIDDGSKDSSGIICDKYMESDERVIVIHKENQGVTSARKAGLEKASGRYITFVDGDDWVDTDYVKEFMDAVKGDIADVVIAMGYTHEEKDSSKKVYSRIPRGLYEGSLLERFFYPNMLSMKDSCLDYGVHPFLCNKLFKREDLVHCFSSVPNSICRGEDVICVYPLLLSVKRVSVINAHSYHYRRWSGSETMKEKYEPLESIIFRHHHLKNVIGDSLIMKEQLYVYMWHNLYNHAMEYLFDKDGEEFFPFGIKRNERVIIYGMGKYGNRIKHILDGFCEIVALTDSRTIEEGNDKMIRPQDIINLAFDRVIVATINPRIEEEIRDILVGIGVSNDKIALLKTAREVKAYIDSFNISKEAELL